MMVFEESELNRSFVGLGELRPAQSKNACTHILYCHNIFANLLHANLSPRNAMR